MDNVNSPLEGGAQDHTQPINMGPDTGSGMSAGSQQSLNQAPPRRRGYGRTTRWVAGLGFAALLVGGGSVLAAQLTSGAGAAPVSTTLTSNGASTGSGSAALSAVLGTAGSANAIAATAFSNGRAGASLRRDIAGLRRCLAVARHLRKTGHRAAARAKARACARQYGLRHLRLLALRLLGGEHGQVTFKTKSGTRTVAFERGVIQTVSGTSVVVKAKDGTTWTWDLIAKTVVVSAKHRAKTSALAAGEKVFVVGPVVSGANDARLIAIRR